MSLSKQEFSNYIKQFNFRELFNDMGWNNDKTAQPIVVDNETYSLQAVAEKSGFKILLCNPLPNGLLPDYNTRRKIETKVTKLFQEHLIIFFDTKKTEQIWQLVVRQSGKPTKVTETRWYINQDPELLYQRAAGIFFELDEEDKITIVDVKNRVGENFHQNNEKVTKQFYDKFKKEHSSFLQFIKGISDKANQEWYASLMLNRLMFCYFIQKKGFLDNNKNYLRDKLKACNEKKGKVKFYSFYRDFLLVLFHKGLNEPSQNKEVKIEIGKIPYLNGGLFDEHELEKTHTGIDIDDKAFEHLFDFFDQYEWHLDTGITATGKDINPDVIGYIFEKYINDRANMGAYYTKEDITDYISKNCILPYLFDETKRNYAKAFTPDGELWQMVKNSGDEYIYDAVKKGVNEPLPREIEQGIKDVSKRTEWNKPATINYALPTEIWREVVDRRNRYTEVKTKIDKGEISAINDFITYNLNIRQFAQDTVENTNDPELLKQFYKALNNVTIIDPTCGSGAFLFAAMNILEPLYESCIMRMRGFTEDEDRENAANKKNFKNKYKYFREVLENIQSPQHPNLPYFIYKSIILRNLYGVDIMKEAVEIAKLRLFLKLVATVEADYRKPNLGLEPLPDIDFNIRAGNTLVGFATGKDLEKHLIEDTLGSIVKEEIDEKCEIVANAFKRYKEIQLTYGDDFKEFKKAKTELNNRLKELNHELNQLLHKQASSIKYETWLESHQPFHWFAEFYEIVQGNGCFDVIIGNPPYVEYSKVCDIYKIRNYETEKCGNLYAFVIERSNNLLKKNGKMGFIVPLSSLATPRMESLLNLYNKKKFLLYSSFYAGDSNPSLLFSGVKSQLSIQLISKTDENRTFVTNYVRWFDDYRSSLFESIKYIEHKYNGDLIYKIGSVIEGDVLNKFILQKKRISEFFVSASKDILYYRNASGSYYRLFLIAPPKLYVNDKLELSSTLKIIKSSIDVKVLHCIFSSNLFHWYWTVISDNYHITKKEFLNFFFNPNQLSEDNAVKLKLISDRLTIDYQENSKFRIETDKRSNSQRKVQIFEPRNSKSIIDEIDTVLAAHYGFTDKELDFIINYDIKYRMGKELESEEE
ncbi:MAG: DNA methyltransferase [Bacteroidia bacterium]